MARASSPVSSYASTRQGAGMSNVIQFPTAAVTISTEDIWFWFIRAQQTRSPDTCPPGPCEPMDVLRALDGLYRSSACNQYSGAYPSPLISYPNGQTN
jgi:hypothetical protein